MINNVEIITGPMFAGKTTELIKRIQSDSFQENEKLLFNYKNDKRYTSNGNIASHNKVVLPSIPIMNCSEILPHLTTETTIIYIDEIQFIENINELTLNQKLNNIKIVLCGINYDIYGNDMNPEFNNLFNRIPPLSITYLKSKCHICEGNADFTALIKEEANINKDNNKLVGTKDVYQPICLIHACKLNYEHNFKRFLSKIYC